MEVIVVCLLLPLQKQFWQELIQQWNTSLVLDLISSLVQGNIPKFPTVSAKRETQVLERTTHYKLKPVFSTGKEYKLVILSQF